MNALSVIVRPFAYGWVVQLSNGQELVRFYGPGAQHRAVRYVARGPKLLDNRRVNPVMRTSLFQRIIGGDGGPHK